MRNKLRYSIIVVITLLVASCKQKTENHEDFTQEIDSTNINYESNDIDLDSVKKNKIKREVVRKLFSKFNLNDLINYYDQNKNPESKSYFMAMAAYDVITDRSEILPSIYNSYIKAFWGEDTIPMKHNITKQEIINLIGPATDKEFIEFTFDDKKNDNFTPKHVKNHSFASMKSCIPALRLRKMVRDPNFLKLEITKGEQTDPPGYKGKYLVAILIYTDTNNVVQYFDIVSDPTIDESGL